MSKEILFSYSPVTDRYEAECALINDGIVWGESKYLTNQEVDGLSSVVDFATVRTETKKFHRYPVEQLAPAFESTDLDDTNFALMYDKFTKE